MAVPIVVKWSGREIHVDDIAAVGTVRDLKVFLQRETGVNPERQKLLNLALRGRQAGDDVPLRELGIKAGQKIMMMGSLEKDIAEVDVPPEERPEVNNDLDVPEDFDLTEYNEINQNKINRRIKEYDLKVINPPREGKRLLVLDIDYTLFDHRSEAETGTELMRPFLHEFLASAYADYDIAIWSATSMKWIEEKMKLLGVDCHKDYKIVFYLDYLAMISVHTQKYGLINVKPLGVVWGKFGDFYGPQNTIMFDDLRRNFLMNPGQGLRIRPFRSAHINRQTDRELVRLANYLRLIAVSEEDFTKLEHNKWEQYIHKKANKGNSPSRRRRHRRDTGAESNNRSSPGQGQGSSVAAASGSGSSSGSGSGSSSGSGSGSGSASENNANEENEETANQRESSS